jgi:hypothetical protein
MITKKNNEKSGMPMSIGKMKKHKLLLKRPGLRRYLPETHWLTPAMTVRMARAYSTIFIKPNHGTGGTGIIRAKRTSRGYEVRCGRRHKYASLHSLYRAIWSFRKPYDRYLVQKGIRLAKYKGSIFDARIYMQKPESSWMISGMAARVAAPKRFVTNYHKGGHAEPLYKMLLQLFHDDSAKVNSRLNKMEKVSYAIARTLGKRFHHIRELGIDMGIDRRGRIWIIEANSKPGHMLFTSLPTKA